MGPLPTMDGLSLGDALWGLVETDVQIPDMSLGWGEGTRGRKGHSKGAHLAGR